MTPTERLAARFEKKDETRKKYKCGKCASCYQLEACPVDHLEDPFCPDYLPPEPTRHEWPSIYREALMKLEEPCDASAQVHRIGRVKSIRSAMLLLHGFSPEDIERIEHGVHQAEAPGRSDVLPA